MTQISLFGWLVILAVAGSVFLISGMIWSERRKRRGFTAKPRGTEPGQGHTLIDAGTKSGGAEAGSYGGWNTSWHVSKDPQSYAKGVMPSNRSDKR